MFKKFLAEHSVSEFNFRADLFPTVEDRAFWESFPNDTCVAEAEAALDYDWPVIKATDFMAYKQSGDRLTMENIHFERRRHLVLFALAELKENKGRFLPQLTNGIFAICEETFWGLSAHMPHHTFTLEDIPMPNENYIDLFAAETAEKLAIISRVLEKPLAAFCPRILERVDEELERRIRVPYPQRRDYIWMGYVTKKVNNWNPWIISNLLTVYLLTDKNTARVKRAIEKMMIELQVYYDRVPADGGCDEGPTYFGRAGLSFFDCLYQLKLSTDGAIDFFGEEKVRNMAMYPVKARLVSDVFINMGDAHVGEVTQWMLDMYAFGKATGQCVVMDMVSAVMREKGDASTSFLTQCRGSTMRRLFTRAQAWYEMQQREITTEIAPPLSVLPDLQIAVARKGDLTLAFKGGHNGEGHNHNDVGSITLYDGQTPLLVDVGINTYTRFTFDNTTRYTMIPWTRTAYHNLPLVNGAEQHRGAEHRADDFRASRDGMLCSFAQAYPEEAGVSTVTRALTLTESALQITDRFAFKGEQKQVREVLMAVLPVRVENGAVIIGDQFRVSAEGGQASAEYVPFEDARLEKDWRCDGITRILFDFDGAEEICIKVERV